MPRAVQFFNILIYLGLTPLFTLLTACQKQDPPTITEQSSEHRNWQWESVNTEGVPTARHEAGLIAFDNALYLIGGRRINPTSVLDLSTLTWQDKSKPPVEIHHFQPVVMGDAIYILGALTGYWPNEIPLNRVLVYYPKEDRFALTHDIPSHRQRGGAGAVVYNNKIYLVGGITEGHMQGYKPWFDEYDPSTGEWRVLADAPHARDHFQATMLNDTLYAFAGRRSSRASGEDMSLTLKYGDAYDFKSNVWLPTTESLALPTGRAGNSAITWQKEILIGGGESTSQHPAHADVEAFNPATGTWRTWPSLLQGRHGTGLVIVDEYMYTVSGAGNRGGGPELTTTERLKLPTEKNDENTTFKGDTTLVHKQWHPLTLSFKGPETSETAKENPFLNYRLSVEFKHESAEHRIRGFYAADGNAAHSHADSGNVWKVHFNPELTGKWAYRAVLHKGKNIALNDNKKAGEKIELAHSQGSFIVETSDKQPPDLRALGSMNVKDSYFYFPAREQFQLKIGANSPENFLAFHEFDGTYKAEKHTRENEASAPDELHRYDAHKRDWQSGDPIWAEEKGKNIIGAINYLADKGMNSIYFLSMNIQGDGNDVWPYIKNNAFTRFDVSKLAQWDIVFKHMQTKGIILHIVLQETENELLLDKGDTGPQRQLYFRELIARFAHHNGVIWNLGEENGPAPWSPNAQNDKQRRSMASFIKQADPYKHPVLLHTHANEPTRSDVLKPLFGFKDIDGLSLQVGKPRDSSNIINTLKRHSSANEHKWLVSMDEIGSWETGALPDALDRNHRVLAHEVLWGPLLSGAAGVEWYFGAKHPHNDLNSEDWRQRDRLWELSAHAKSFFEKHLPYSKMTPLTDVMNTNDAFCFALANEIYAIYLPKPGQHTIDLSKAEGTFTIQWYNPQTGGKLLGGSKSIIQGGERGTLGAPPSVAHQDWVVLLKKQITEESITSKK